MMKKPLSLFLCIVLLCAMLPMGMVSAMTATAEYKVVNGEAIVTSCWTSGSGGLEFVIPDTLGGYPVTGIADKAFDGYEVLYSLTIPDSVKTIGEGAFANCVNLTYLTIGSDDTDKSGTVIKSDAFRGCIRLAVVTLGRNVTAIEDYAFFGDTALTAMKLPDGITSVGESAFNGCTKLESINMPDSLTFIGANLFGGTALSSNPDKFVNGRWYIGNHLFGLSSDFTGEYVFGENEGCYANGAFTAKSGLTAITLPDSVTAIEENAFYGCKNLTSITIPGSVTSVGSNAFYNCSSLTELDLPDSITYIDSGAFNGCSGLKSFTIPEGTTHIGSGAFAKCSGITSLTLPKNVETLSAGALASIPNLTVIRVDENNPYFCAKDNILFDKDYTTLIQCPAGYDGVCTIPDSVTTIKSYAFGSCKKLDSVTFGKNVTTIGSFAFDTCTHLITVDLPNSVHSIGERAFNGCSWLNSVTLGSGISSIGYYAFTSTDLIDIYYHGTEEDRAAISIAKYNTDIDEAVWHYADEPYWDPSFIEYEIKDGEAIITDVIDAPSKVVIPSTLGGCPVTTLGDESFRWNSGMHNVTIPDTVTHIGVRAFDNCSNLYTVRIPDSVTYIGAEAFQYCVGLAGAVFGNGIRSIESKMFYNCYNLISVYIPENVTSIKENAFNNCNKLTSVFLPEGVTTLETCAFNNCYRLASITLPNSLVSIDKDAFIGCSAMAEVYYNGTEEEREEKLTIDTGNNTLTDATWHYNCINPKDHFSGKVDHSIMDTDRGNGFAHRFQMLLQKIKKKVNHMADYSEAVVNFMGFTCRLISMGTVASNTSSVSSTETLTLERVNGKSVINIPTVYLLDVEDDKCTFATRIVNIPDSAAGRTIYTRPYYVIEIDGQQVTIYGDVHSASCSEYM